MIVVIILPLLGYFGARTYSRKLVLGYFVYLVAIIAVRAVLISINDNEAFISVQIVIILLELLVIVYIIKLFRILGKLSEEDKFYLIGAAIMNDPDADDSSSAHRYSEENQEQDQQEQGD
mmetsp:Transcript_31384/g.5668  ORF Transcript_31384/g.5668 Transcript_31384/m.5668 type:complete len:120 (+) Transcript_31384:241-600(+)